MLLRVRSPTGPGALDVLDGDAVLRRLDEARPDGIVHLAGISSVAWSHAHPVQTFQVNTLGTVSLLEAVRITGRDTRVLVVGSGEMYGRIPQGHGPLSRIRSGRLVRMRCLSAPPNRQHFNSRRAMGPTPFVSAHSTTLGKGKHQDL